MSDLPQLLFVCVFMSTHTSHKKPYNESFIIYMYIETTASNNNYANDLLAFRLYCITL